MLKIGLTGGIGSGKTTISSIFRLLGIPVFDADREAKLIMETDAEVMFNIQKAFGQETYTNGQLNKTYLANIVFNNLAQLNKLNAFIHPAAILAANKWMNDQRAPYVIKEAALMFEAGSTSNLDYVVGVYTPQQVRIKRVMERDNASQEQVLVRMSRQMDETVKMRLCDFVVSNDEQKLLIPQVLQLHDKFISIYMQKRKQF